ncbi:hypothetical protein D7V20_17340, partial [Acinetobacter rongchengensis]
SSTFENWALIARFRVPKPNLSKIPKILFIIIMTYYLINLLDKFNIKAKYQQQLILFLPVF